jgi:uncharacterized membrane protein
MSSRVREAAAVVLIGILGYSIGTTTVAQFQQHGGHPFFYQPQFGPAVSVVCGRGYRNVQAEDGPALGRFLLEQTDALSCSELPHEIAPRPLNAFQRLTRYLELLVAWTWKARGIRWSALLPIFGLLYGAMGIALYGVFRLGAGSIVSGLFTAFVLVSPLGLENLSNLRDFSKAPFALGLVGIIALIGRPGLPERAIRWLCLAAGVLFGVGLGFRSDLLLFVPFVALAALLAPVRSGSPLQARAIRLASYAAGLLAAGLPMFREYASGSNTGHVVLLGLMTPFDQPLRLQRPLYDVGYLYNDSYAYVLVNSFANRALSVTGQLNAGSAEYDQAAVAYVRSIFVLLPADLLIRLGAAIAGVLSAPFTTDATSVNWLGGPVSAAARLHAQIAAALPFPAVLSAVVALGVAYVTRAVRWATAILLVAALTATAALQFHPRHFFYLEVIVWWPLATVVQAAIDRGRGRARALHPAAVPRRSHRLVACLLLLPLILPLARTYQQRKLGNVLAQLINAPTTDVDTITRQTASLVSYEVRPVRGEGRYLNAPYYRLEFGGPACDRTYVEATIRYASDRPFNDFTRKVGLRLPLDGTSIPVFLPLFDADTQFFWLRFVAIELPVGDTGCVSAIRRLAAPGPLVLVEAELTPNWREMPLYQKLQWESPAPPLDGVRLATVPAVGFSRRTAVRALSVTPRGAASWTARTVTPRGSGYELRGVADGPFTEVIHLRSTPVAAGAVAVVRGTLTSGGLTLGLQQHGQWIATTTVVDRGPYAAVLQAPAAGDYDVVVANCLAGPGRANWATVEHIGWVEAR